MLRVSFRTNLIAYLFMAPFLLGFLAFLVGPLVYALVLSLFRESMIGATRFVGFANYLQVVQDAKFWEGIWNMLVFGVILVVMLLKWPQGLWPAVERFLPKPMLRNRAGEGLTRTVLTENRGEVLLRLEEIGIRFGGLQALEGIDMELKRGEFV